MPRAVKLADSLYGPIAAYADDLITRQIEDFGQHTRPEFAFATCVLDRGEAVFDIGAHIGTFALAAGVKVGATGKVLAIEADEETYQHLQQNIRRGVWIRSRREAVYPTTGDRLRLEQVEANSGASHVVADVKSELQSISLDHLIQAEFEPSYIKIDVEGLEYSILSASKYVHEQRPTLYLEVNSGPTLGADKMKLSEFLLSCGYRFFVNVGPRNARFDGFKVAAIDTLDRRGLFDVLCLPRDSLMAGLMDKIAG